MENNIIKSGFEEIDNKNKEDDTTFNRLVELQKLLKNESALKELFIKTGVETKKNIEKQCEEIYKKKIEVLNIKQKLNIKQSTEKIEQKKDNKSNKNEFYNNDIVENILIENNYDYLLDLNTYIRNLISYLWDDPKLLADLLLNSEDDDIKKYLAPLICNNFYENILSSNYIEDPLMYIIYLLLDKEIKTIGNIREPNSFLNKSKCGYLLSQLIEKKDVKDFFKIILQNIMQDIGSNKFNFNISQIDEKINNKNKEKMGKKENKNNNIKNATKHESNNLNIPLTNNIDLSYKLCQPSEINDSDQKEKSKLIKDNPEYQDFNYKYLKDISFMELKNEISKTENKSLKEYYNFIILNSKENEQAYSLSDFNKSISNSKYPEIVWINYAQDFLKIKEFMDKLFNNLIYNFRIVPYSIKCICKIIYKLVSNYFPQANDIEKNIFISKFFFDIIFSQFLLKPDINALINEYIISKNIIVNAKIVNNILLQLVSFKLYENSPMLQGNNYLPFNQYFLEIIPKVFEFYNLITEVKLPHFIDELLNHSISIEEFHFDYFKENPNEVLFYKSILLNIDEFNAIFKNLKNNKDKLLQYEGNQNNINNKENIAKREKNYKLIKIALDRINSEDNNNLLKELLQHKQYTSLKKEIIKDGIFSKKKQILEKKMKNIQYFHISQLLFNDKYEKIFSLEQKNPYYHIKELKNKEMANQNNVIKAKNFISTILYNYRMLVKSDFGEGKTDNTNSILRELKFFMKSSNFLIDGNIPSEWYISALLEYLQKLPEKYKDNDYELLYKELKNELINSISLYNFNDMSIFIDKMKYSNRNKMYFSKTKEIYLDIELNNKANKIIENDPLNVFIKCKFTKTKNEFNIYEDASTKELDFLDSFMFVDESEKGKRCKTIEHFTKNFPNLNKLIAHDGLIEDGEDSTLLNIQKEINLPEKLKVFFNIINNQLKINIKNEKEVNIINDKIYDYVMEKISHKIFPKVKHATDDQLIQKACMLSWIEPHNIINENNVHYDFELILPDISKYFKLIRKEKSPRRKLLNLNKIFSSINRLLIFNRGKKDIGVDDQMPLLTYCFIKTKPFKIYSNLKFMELYIGDKKNKGEGNQLSQMFSICSFIKQINSKSLYNVTEEDFSQKCQISFKEYMHNYLENNFLLY